MKRMLLLLLLFAAKTLCAQQPYKFFPLFLDKGLSDARVNAIAQDHLGFMWFASANGLNRYDGYSIKTYYADVKNNGLSTNHTTALFSDSKGDFWVGTANGLVRYNFAKEKFERFGEKEAINTAFVNCITEDSSGNIYAGTNEGLFWWNRNKKEWKNMSAQLGKAERLVTIRGLLFFDKKTLFATTEGKGFYKIDISKPAYRTIDYHTKFRDTCCLFTIGMQKMDDSTMLIGTLSLGLSKFNVNRDQYIPTEGPLTLNDSILFNTTYQVIKDHSGRFWAASYYFRLAEYFPATNTAIPIPQEPFNPYGFSGNAATTLFEDRQHNIWIGTPKQGVFRFNPSQNGVRFYSSTPVNKEGLQPGNVMSLARLGNSLLMVGSDVGPNFYNKAQNRFINYRGIAKEFGNLPLEQVQCGIMDREGMVWMGTNRLGLMRYDTLKKTFRTFGRLTPRDTLKDDGINHILEMEADSIMLIGWNRINTFNKKTFKHHSFRNDSLPLYKLKEVADVCYDQTRQFIWIATINGQLYQYYPANKKLLDRSALMTAGLSSAIINNIDVDGQNRLWLASSIGAVCIQEGQPPKFYTFSQSPGASKEIKNVVANGDDLWITNSRVLARLNSHTGKLFYLGEKDGFNNVQLFANSLMVSAWNTVLIGSSRGFYEIDAQIKEPSNGSSPAFLTQFKVYDRPLETGEAISTIQQLKLGYDQNFFSFDISAFDYSQGTDIEYAYKLEGFDNDWQYIGRNRSGSYTNIPGGHYKLLLKARNSNGEWNENGQSVKIFVAKPFWLTTWFRILTVLLLTAVIYLFYRTRVNHIKKEARLHSDYAIRLNDLENSALRTQMSPHFIFNSLNTINSFINRNDPARANQYISKFSKLIRLILDHSRQKKITLAEELEVLELYVQLERIRFDNKFDYNVDIDENISTDSTEIPPLIIQPFAENAILHGLLPLAEGGVLRVAIHKTAASILCIIEDNGIGRKQAGLNKPDYTAHRKSHGIDITLKRIELFNKEHSFEGRVAITDKLNPDGSPAGTKIEIPIALEESF
ncbi:MAG: hypothetical protein EOO13_05705 [Chitinophagaceae bacterium]|nr:MAG: hypothetical protein EOO13_05705 [Chitinophagaceae bacterium]